VEVPYLKNFYVLLVVFLLKKYYFLDNNLKFLFICSNHYMLMIMYHF